MCITALQSGTLCQRLCAARLLSCAVAVAVLVGCQPTSSTSGGAAKPKAKYEEPVAAAAKLGVTARADSDGEVIYLDFYHAPDIPRAIVYVKEFPNVKKLNFSSTNLSDAEMPYLADAKELEEVGLHGTKITDDGLVHLAGLGKLKIVNLNDTQVTDAGLAHLSGLVNLEQLRLQSTEVTDGGLGHITPLTKLKVVWLSGSQVTADGAAKLKEALPDADVVNEEILEGSSGPLLPASAFQQE